MDPMDNDDSHEDPMNVDDLSMDPLEDAVVEVGSAED